jgi:predicted O-methyltransferase YrrM
MVKDIIQIKQKFDYNIIIETGTETGKSTRVLKNIFDKIYTCEIDKSYFSMYDDLYINPNIKIMQGESTDCLKEFFTEIGHDKFFLYLDAHKKDSFPILNELQLVSDFKYKPVIIIHDFDCKINGFRYDKYIDENNNTIYLNWDYIKNKVELIYGVDGYGYVTNTKSDTLTGVITIYPKLKNII